MIFLCPARARRTAQTNHVGALGGTILGAVNFTTLPSAYQIQINIYRYFVYFMTINCQKSVPVMQQCK